MTNTSAAAPQNPNDPGKKKKRRFEDILSNARANFQRRGGMRNGPKIRREHTRHVIKVSRMDEVEWDGNVGKHEDLSDLYMFDRIEGVRNDPEVDAAIADVFFGDINNPEERAPYYNAPELFRDIFMTFYKPQPTQYKKVEVKKDARLNQKFIVQLMELPVYEEVHDYTMTDAETSKEAMLSFVDAIKQLIQDHREAVEKANEERIQDGDPGPQGPKEDKIWDKSDAPKRPPQKPGKDGKPGNDGQDGDGDGQQGGNSPGKNDDNGGKSQVDDQEGDGQDSDDDEGDGQSQEDWDYHDLDDEDEDDSGDQGGESGDGESGEGDDEDGDGDGEGASAFIDDQEREFNENYDEGDFEDDTDWEKLCEGFDVARQVNSALEDYAEDQRELNDIRTGVGIDDAEWKMMDPKERMRIAKQLNTPRMKQIADMVGRMKRFALSKQAQKIIDAPHEIFTVEMGNDLRRVLRSEFAFLGTPETKIEFYRRFAEGQLLQYKERGHEDVGKGPIICCIDNSGSMGGAPENWAKGVAEALRRICQDQDRDFHAIYFETNRHRERFDFPKGKGPFEKVMAFLGISAGGGTEFDGVLTEALGKAKTFFEGKPEHGKSDIVFITDGQAYLDQSWIDRFNEERREAGVRTFGIYISAYDSSRGPAMKLLESFCDVAIPVKQLEVNDDTTSALFAQI